MIIPAYRLLMRFIAPAFSLLIGCGPTDDSPSTGKPSTGKDSIVQTPSGANPPPGDSASQTSSSTRPAAAAAPLDTNPTIALTQALTNMETFTSFHAAGTTTAGGNRTNIVADFGPGTASIAAELPDGKRVWYRIVEKRSVTSIDNGATWITDETTTGVGLAQMITSVVRSGAGLTEQGEILRVGQEEVDRIGTTHLRVVAASPIDVWVAADPTHGPYVKRISLAITANDAQFILDMVYSRLNEPVDIKLP